jgi:hypothetical protein
MTISLAKVNTTAQGILLREGMIPEAHRMPEVREVLAFSPDSPLGKINARFELRTAWAETEGHTAPLVPAGIWASRLVSEPTTWGMHGHGPILSADDEPSLDDFR